MTGYHQLSTGPTAGHGVSLRALGPTPPARSPPSFPGRPAPCPASSAWRASQGLGLSAIWWGCRQGCPSPHMPARQLLFLPQAHTNPQDPQVSGERTAFTCPAAHVPAASSREPSEPRSRVATSTSVLPSPRAHPFSLLGSFLVLPYIGGGLQRAPKQQVPNRGRPLSTPSLRPLAPGQQRHLARQRQYCLGEGE